MGSGQSGYRGQTVQSDRKGFRSLEQCHVLTKWAWPRALQRRANGGRMDYFVDGEFTHDWTSHHLKLWEELLGDKAGTATAVLEIGSFEGRSALFFLQFLPKSRITCVDSFQGSEEHLEPGSKHESDMAEVERRFDRNLKPFAGRVEKRKGHSLTILPGLAGEGRLYDVVYVDGDHCATSVYSDARLAWDLLDNDGVMILDDYRWGPDLPMARRPQAGIEAFLSQVAGEYELLHRGQQIVIRKSENVAAKSFTIAGRDIDGLAGGALSPPLVSFVVINWNYCGYVGATIDSIRRQDYPHFECIVINNGSTDDSAQVIARHVEGDPRFRVETLAQNHGQLGAALWALDKVNGGFVTFVDADDVLFDNYASTHIQVHMALQRSVGFTSANVAEMDSTGAALTASYQQLRLNRPGAQRGLRGERTVLRLPTVSPSQYRLLDASTATIPRAHVGWFWAPGSANMFRTSVLHLLRLDDGSKPWMTSADGYFNTICHAVAGSALIDMPLSGYRLHSSNYFATGESVEGIRSGTREYAAKLQKFTYESVKYLIEGSERFDWLSGGEFWPVVDRVTRENPDRLRDYFSDEIAVEIFERNAPQLRSVFGARRFSREVLARFSGAQARSILRAGFGGRIPMRVLSKSLLRDVRISLRIGRKR
ncbi:glycosyltransferase [Mesorhizobium sp. CA6]|uniref:glycosyltransferase n=1 Tax=Mesorhizobium sp. CA6 TaxID=588500 RepID=UPI001CCF15F9|nr:glycosyltransferase [Mesorhizobium sp. CA6]MBZ9766684.1 glycosyltransferase [Mesorhizobium sp. CA6]